MMTNRQSFRSSLCVASLVAGAALLASCGSTPSEGATASATSTPTATATPLATNSAVDSTTPASVKAGTAAPSKASTPRPRDAGDYGQVLLDSWAAGKTAAVADFASSSAAATLRGAKAPSGLLLTTCEDNLCSWSNEAGKRVTLTFDTAKVSAGAAHAVTKATVS